MPVLSDDDRELWLSRYLDGELDEAATTAVAERLRTDEVWRKEFEALERDDRLVASVARRHVSDDGFSARLVEKLRARPRVPSPAAKGPDRAVAHAHKRVRRTGAGVFRFLFRAAALVVLAVGGVAGWRYYAEWSATNSRAQVAAVARPAQPTDTTTIVTEEQRSIVWADGSRIVARKGTTLRSLGSRALEMDRGQAFFNVTPNKAAPFSIRCGPVAVEVLGTRFELTTVQDGVRVRVAEGRVRVTAADGKPVEAVAGQEILPGSRVQPFDVRELSAAWKLPEFENLAAPWPQIGGSPGHTAMTPLAGPVSLVANRELFYKLPEGAEPLDAGAVVSARQRAYVLVRSSAVQARLHELPLSGAAQGAWRRLDAAAHAAVAPIITAQGLLITVSPDVNVVNAFDAEAGRQAWSYKEDSAVCGLAAMSCGTVLLSTVDGLAALDGNTGKLLWRCAAVQELREPVAVLASGLICGAAEDGHIYTLDQTGQVLNSFSWPRPLLQAPVAALGDGDAVWLASTDGYAARMNLDKPGFVEKSFGSRLKCAPTATGLMGVDMLVQRFDGGRSFICTERGDAMALVQDGQGSVFVGYRKGVLHLRGDKPGADFEQMKAVSFSNVADGEIVKHGLAIVPGKLIVTTTRGIQVFE